MEQGTWLERAHNPVWQHPVQHYRNETSRDALSGRRSDRFKVRIALHFFVLKTWLNCLPE